MAGCEIGKEQTIKYGQKSYINNLAQGPNGIRAVDGVLVRLHVFKDTGGDHDYIFCAVREFLDSEINHLAECRLSSRERRVLLDFAYSRPCAGRVLL